MKQPCSGQNCPRVPAFERRALLKGGATSALLPTLPLSCGNHESCPVSVVGAQGHEELSCPCHGSLFDANGAVTRGPANAPLPHFLVEVTSDGSITIHDEQTVSADTRVPVV